MVELKIYDMNERLRAQKKLRLSADRVMEHFRKLHSKKGPYGLIFQINDSEPKKITFHKEDVQEGGLISEVLSGIDAASNLLDTANSAYNTVNGWVKNSKLAGAMNILERVKNDTKMNPTLKNQEEEFIEDRMKIREAGGHSDAVSDKHWRQIYKELDQDGAGVKDPNEVRGKKPKAKREQSKWNLFVKQNYPALKANNPDMTLAEATKILSKMYKATKGKPTPDSL